MRRPDSLPIDRIEHEVRHAFRDDAPTVVVAPTGSGKSTRLPQWYADELDTRVVVVEPRRVACRSLAGYLASTRGEKAGSYYGYCVRFDAKYDSKKTRVVFVTPGVALNWLIDGQLADSAVLIDEFHERSVDNDLLAAALLADSAKCRHLAFTSATMDGEQLAEQIGGRLLTSEGRTFPVETRYLDEPSAPSERDLDGRIESAVRALRDDGVSGGILVFLPTWKSIRNVQSHLESAFGRSHPIFAVHGSMAMSEIEAAFQHDGDGDPIFLSTNVAETSLTIPGVRAVIDSGLVKQRLHRAGRSALAVIPTSLASMEQRAGRAGRVSAGRCVRLFARRFRAQPFTPPEIEREPLDDLLLSAARMGFDGAEFDKLVWVTPPPDHALTEARARLQTSQMLDAQGRLTERGRDAGRFPVSAHLAPVLALADASIAGSVADTVAILEVGGRLFRPVNSESADEKRKDWVARSPCALYDELLALREGNPRRHGLQPDVLFETRRIANQLREQLGVMDRVERDRSELPTPEQLAVPFIEGWRECAFVERARVSQRDRARHRSVPWTNGDVEIFVDTADVERRRSEPVSSYEAALVLDHDWVQGTGVSVRGYARTVLPVSIAVFRDSGIGDAIVSEAKFSKSRSGNPKITAFVQRRIGKVQLASEEEMLTGHALRDAAADFVLQRRVVKGTVPELHRRLHLLSIVFDWPEEIAGKKRAGTVPEAHDWLTTTLETLGVEEALDLALLEPDDLLPNVAELTGLPFWELESFAADFPYIWEHLGAEYRVLVTARSRKVTLEPANKSAKNAGEPPRAVLPSFRGFSVYFSKASRRVKIR